MDAPARRDPPRRILYIDDDAELGLLFKRWVEHCGCEVSTASDPRQALADLDRHPRDYDLVVADYRMPDLDGIEVARAIHDHYPWLRCAVVAGDVSGDMLAVARACGIGPVLRKPFTPAEYEDLLRRCTA